MKVCLIVAEFALAAARWPLSAGCEDRTEQRRHREIDEVDDPGCGPAVLGRLASLMTV